MRAAVKHAVLLAVGGALYCLIELIWRGRTHPAMFAVGGLAFVLIGLINEVLNWDTPLPEQMILAATAVTAVEFAAGLVLNLWLGLGIWDYSGLPGNVLGQICPQFWAAWCALSLPAIVLDDWLRYRLFGEDKPRYVWM